MKRLVPIFALIFPLCPAAHAEKTSSRVEDTTAVLPSERGKTLAAADAGWDWIDGERLKIEGKVFDNADGWYSRLPKEAKTNVVWGTWVMSKCPAGMSVVFTTTSPKLRVNWSLGSTNLNMANMASTGVSGVDLYRRLESGRWRFVKMGVPRRQQGNEFEVGVKPGGVYRLYLPLYNSLSSLKFGILKGSKLSSVPLCEGEAPIVFYGGSTTQGACVSRPGMAWCSIVGRMLGRPTACMGFNGQGKMIPYEAELLAKADASVYCFLSLGNMVSDTYAEEAEAFLRRLKELRPETPILFGAFHYPLVKNDRKHAFAAELKVRLQSEDPVKWRNFDIVPLGEMCSDDLDGTVDGGHPNDYGAYRMAEGFAGRIKKLVSPRAGERKVGQ